MQVPTTLMAAIDASIGIKTAVNFDTRKNKLGTYCPPLGVFIDRSALHLLTSWLRSLCLHSLMIWTNNICVRSIEAWSCNQLPFDSTCRAGHFCAHWILATSATALLRF